MNLYAVNIIGLLESCLYLVLAETKENSLKTILDNKNSFPVSYDLLRSNNLHTNVTFIMNTYEYDLNDSEASYFKLPTGIVLMEYFNERYG